MKKDKKIQKEIQRQFETPDIPFAEWAEQNGIQNVPQTAECPVLQPAGNAEGGGAPHASKKKILSVCLPLLALLVALAVALGCLLHKPAPKIYGANDVSKQDVTLQDIAGLKEVYLFDTSGVVRVETAYKEVLIKDNSRVMLYTVRNCLLSVKNGEGYDGFYITYRVRLYPHYQFLGEENYSKLNGNAAAQGKTIDYGIRQTNQPTGYAKFTMGKCEYFIEAYGIENVTVLNEANFLNLLNQILI